VRLRVPGVTPHRPCLWRPRELWTHTGARVELTAAQRDVIAQIAGSITPLDLAVDPLAALHTDPAVARTIAKLGLAP
jgi:hypothetical protein